MNRFVSSRLFCILLFAVQIAFSQTPLKTWTETTVQDFSDSQMDSLVVTNIDGGEVQLPAPLARTAEDLIDNTLLRTIAKDSTGAFVRTWEQGGNVFVRKYASDGTPVTGNLVVNDSAGTVYPTRSNVVLFNDGTFLVVWVGYIESKFGLYGQIFADDSVRIGLNFKINESPIGMTDPPGVLANTTDQSFWIFYSPYSSSGYKIHAQVRDKAANKVRETFLLNPVSATKDEGNPSVIQDGSGFVVTWWGADVNNGNYTDIYLRKFDAGGTAAGTIIKVNDDIGPHSQGMPILCSDAEQNLLVVWMDSREGETSYHLYGQMYNANGVPIGSNKRLESVPWGQNREPELVYTNGEFQLSWRAYIESSYQTYVNRWRFEPTLSGILRSSIYDSGPAGASLQKIFWVDTSTAPAAIRFRLRTGNTVDSLLGSLWYGPTDTSGYYTNGSGEEINPVHIGQRYIQYQAYFHAADASRTILHSVSITYLPSDSTAPLPPTGVIASAGHASVRVMWEGNQEPDVAGYWVYRDTVSGALDSAGMRLGQTAGREFVDSTATVGTRYFYAVTAYDSSGNESSYSTQASAVSYAGNVYVSATAPPGGDGSIERPFNTIHEAISAALHEDTVRVLAGTYNENVTMVNSVSLMGAAADQCVIEGSLKAADRCVIKGLTITKTVQCASVSPLIIGNIIRNSGGAAFPAAIELTDGASPVITRNFVSECVVGIHVYHLCNPLITNNIIYAQDFGIYIWWMEKPVIRNNTIIAQQLGAIGGPSDTIVAENNILVTEGSNPVAPIPPGPARQISFNCFWNPYISGGDTSAGNIFANPQFVNPQMQDFRLSATSPCRNAGNPDPRFNDIDGSRNDMGAFGGPDPFEQGLSAQLIRSLAISRASGYPGDTIAVFLHIDEAKGLASATATVEFNDTLLTLTHVLRTSAAASCSLQTHMLSPREARITLTTSAVLPDGQQDLLELRFAINGNAITGDASPLAFKNVSLLDASLRSILLRSIVDGAVVVNDYGASEHYLFVDSRAEGVLDGTRQHPFKTITQGVNRSRAGDSVLVAGGTYVEAVIMKDSVSVIGAGATVTCVIATGEQSAFQCTNMRSGEISGFTIKASQDHMPTVPFVACASGSPIVRNNRIEAASVQMYGIICTDSSRAIIERNYIKGISIGVFASSPRIRNNIIEGPQSQGIECNGGSPVIQGNKFASDLSMAITIRQASPTVRNNFILCDQTRATGISVQNAANALICNNIILDRSGGETGISIRNCTALEIANNTIITRGKGIEDQLSISTMVNNIITGNIGYGLQASTTSQYDYNDVWNNAVDYLEISPGLHDISQNPIFLDTAKSDYRLSPNSPCINAGSPDPKYTDRDGSRSDIGAFGGPFADSTWIPTLGTSIGIDSLIASSADTMRIMVQGGHVKGIAGIAFTLSYDPAILTIINAQTAGLTRSFMLQKTAVAPGSFRFTLTSDRGIVEEDGELIRLQCTASTKQSAITYLHFDSANVSDEVSCERTIAWLRDGKITITPTGMDGDRPILMPQAYELLQNFPNPFNPSTTIRYALPHRSHVTLTIYNLLGQKVAELIQGDIDAGYHEVRFDASNLASGVYFYRLQARSSDSAGGGAGLFIETRKLLLLR